MTDAFHLTREGWHMLTTLGWWMLSMFWVIWFCRRANLATHDPRVATSATHSWPDQLPTAGPGDAPPSARF